LKSSRRRPIVALSADYPIVVISTLVVATGGPGAASLDPHLSRLVARRGVEAPTSRVAATAAGGYSLSSHEPKSTRVPEVRRSARPAAAEWRVTTDARTPTVSPLAGDMLTCRSRASGEPPDGAQMVSKVE
jgi:hypothetical protein